MKLTQVIKTLCFSGACTLALTLVPSVAEKSAEKVGVDVDFGVSAQAQSTRGKRKLPGINVKFAEKMGEVEALISPPEEPGQPAKKPDLAGAAKLLARMEKGCSGKTPCNGYELANLYNFYAYVSYERDDIAGAARYFEKVVAQSPNIPWGLEEQTLLQLAKLFSGEEQYKKAITYMDKYMSIVETVYPDAYYTKSTICYQMEDYTCSLNNINKAVSMTEAEGFVPKEPWYNLQRGILNQKEDYRNALEANKKLVTHYAKKKYWNDLASFYSLLEQYDKSQAILDTGLVGGTLFKETQYTQLAQLLYQSDAPYNAARVLEKGIEAKVVKDSEKNLERAGRYYYNAKEFRKSIDFLTRAGELSENGNIFNDVVGIYVALEDMKGAIAMGKRALKKGKLKKPGRLHFQMGTAYFEMKQFSNAIKSFEKGAEYKPTKRVSEQWLSYAKKQRDRYKALAEFLK